MTRRQFFDPGSVRGNSSSYLTPAEKGAAMRRCREAGEDPYVNDAWKRYTPDALRREAYLQGTRPETAVPPVEPAKRSFSPAEREPWCNRSAEQVEQARRDAERQRQASLRNSY